MSSNAANHRKPLIACLGWGSLVWKRGELPVVGDWLTDGPLLPVEFARESSTGSSAGALTLVVVPGYGAPVRSLWTLLSVDTPEEAREALRKREGVPVAHRENSIAMWKDSAPHEPLVPEISTWARDRRLSAVVWTALPPKFADVTGRMPTAEEAVRYLRGLTGEQRQNAETYVRMAPRQVDTPYRKRFVAELGWIPTAKM